MAHQMAHQMAHPDDDKVVAYIIFVLSGFVAILLLLLYTFIMGILNLSGNHNIIVFLSIYIVIFLGYLALR